MAATSISTSREPLSEINTTPLIDVMLVLLIMIVVTIPLSTHSIEVDLPAKIDGERPHPVSNLLEVEADGALRWNGGRISERELVAHLAHVRAMAPEPEVRFRPDPQASYERSARVLQLVKHARITNFGFLDNEKYRSFSRAS